MAYPVTAFWMEHLMVFLFLSTSNIVYFGVGKSLLSRFPIAVGVGFFVDRLGVFLMWLYLKNYDTVWLLGASYIWLSALIVPLLLLICEIFHFKLIDWNPSNSSLQQQLITEETDSSKQELAKERAEDCVGDEFIYAKNEKGESEKKMAKEDYKKCFKELHEEIVSLNTRLFNESLFTENLIMTVRDLEKENENLAAKLCAAQAKSQLYRNYMHDLD